MKAMLRSRLTRAALAAVVVLPLLYAGLYLWSFWDPQGNLDRVPVALVMEDRPATVDGKTVDAGKELADELADREVFDWRRTTAQEAADGVNDGSFYLSLTIPRDFSANLSSPSDDKSTPSPAQLGLRVDTGRSYIVGTISDAVFNEVRSAAARTAVRDYFDKVFVSIGDIHDKTTEAADGAGELRDGTVKAGDGVSQLNTGLGSAEDGAEQLSVGLNSANTATGKLQNGSAKVTQGIGKATDAMGKLKKGLDELGDGAGKLADGNRQAYEQVHAQRGTVNQLADKYVPVLNEYGPRVAESANAVADAADQLADGLEGLAARTGGNAQEAASQARAALDLLDGESDPQLRDLLRSTANAAERAAEQAGQLQERLGGTSTLPERARELAANARKVAALAPELGPKLDQVREQVNALDAGLAKLADGAAKLDTGATKAGQGVTKLHAAATKLQDGSQQVTDGIGKLGGGLVKLGDGATQLHSGVGKLHDGAGKVDDGMNKLTKGSQDLADGLGDGAEKIPDYSQQQRESRTDVMSDPVRLAKTVDNEVPNYGTGFAPFFLPLALWVGAMIAFMVLKPLNQRLLAGASGPLRIVMAGWLPALALGVAQVGVLLAVLRFALGLEAAHWAGVAGLLLLTAAAFMAIVQAVNALLGAPGRVAALALLMLQLTSAAGTYPIETSPGFFQTISPWLPMSWVVSALRRLISGGDLTVVWQACGVLSAFLLLALALTALAVERSRVWSVKRLHPELSL